MRVKNKNICTLSFQNIDDLKCRAFPYVINICLVSQSKNSNFCAFYWLFYFLQLLFQQFNCVVWHAVVYFPCKLQKFMFESNLLGLFNEIIRVNRDAMHSNTSSRVMGHERKRLCGSSFYHF